MTDKLSKEKKEEVILKEEISQEEVTIKEETEEVVTKEEINEDAIQKLEKIRLQMKGVYITPSHPHYVDISVVYSENSYNIIGYILTNFGMLFIGLYYAYPDKSMPLYGYFFWGVFLFGFCIYAYGKYYLHKKINEEKIELDEYYGED